MNTKEKREPAEEPLKIPLDFEEVLADLMKIKPVENDDLRKSARTEKGDPKKKKDAPEK